MARISWLQNTELQNNVALGGPELWTTLCGNVSYNSTTLGRSKIFSGDESDGSMRGRLSKGCLSASFVVPLGKNSIKIYEKMVPQEQDILYSAGWVPTRTSTLENNSTGPTVPKSHKPCNPETSFLVLCPGTMVIKHDCTLKLSMELLRNTSAWVPTPSAAYLIGLEAA